MTTRRSPGEWRWSRGWARLKNWETRFGLIAGVSGRVLGDMKKTAHFRRHVGKMGFAPDRWAGGQQVHGARVRWANTPSAPREFEQTDGVATDRADVFLRVFTADCVPVFMAHAHHPGLGLVHSGWRGTRRRVLTRAIALLHRRVGGRPSDIHVSLGPHLRNCCYVVGDDVARAFRKIPGATRQHPREEGKHLLDLETVLRAEAHAAGVTHFSAAPWCTVCDQRFFSYRRDKTDRRQVAVLGRRKGH